MKRGALYTERVRELEGRGGRESGGLRLDPHVHLPKPPKVVWTLCRGYCGWTCITCGMLRICIR